MRADRLLRLLHLLQRHGGLPARRLAELLEVSERTVLRDMEALSAAQGCELRAPLTTSPELASAIALIRRRVSFLEDDRYMAPDLAAATDLVRSGAFAGAVSSRLLPGLER